MENIYIKPPKKVVIKLNQIITIGDVVTIECRHDLKEKIKKLRLLELKGKKKQNLLIDFIDISRLINKNYPNLNLINVGESDTIISYIPDNKKENKLWTYTKVVFICLILFFGAAFAIMTFHTDSSVPHVFSIINEIFTGETVTKPYAVIIPYSLGIAFGIIVFFNHFSSKKITDDPTPIEVELRTYEDDVEETIIENLAKEKGENNE